MRQKLIRALVGAVVLSFCTSFGVASQDDKGSEYSEIVCATLDSPGAQNPEKGECAFEVVENMAYGATVLEVLVKTSQSAQFRIEKACETHGMHFDRYAYADISGGIADLKINTKDFGSGLIVSKLSGRFTCSKEAF